MIKAGEYSQIVVEVTLALPIQSLEMTMDGLLKGIRQFSEPPNALTWDDFRACFEEKCEGRHFKKEHWATLMGECLEGRAAK